MTTKEICDFLGGKLIGDPNIEIRKPGKIEEAGPGSISFLGNLKYEKYLESTNASAILIPSDYKIQKQRCTYIKVPNVYESVGKLLMLFEEKSTKSGISETASVHKDANISNSAFVGNYSIIEEGVIIGDGSQVAEQVYIGKNVKIGSNCRIYPGVRILKDSILNNGVIIHSNAVIGSDGFGYSKLGSEYMKIPQIGNVILEEGVEIGANTTIDRATMGSTILHKGVKIDNLVQIAHNVEIGENTAIAAQTGIAGSAKIGKNCQIGGQVGIIGHISIPDGTMIQAQSGVVSRLKKENMQICGSPAIGYTDYFKSYSVFKDLPEMAREVKRLRREINRLNQAD